MRSDFKAERYSTGLVKRQISPYPRKNVSNVYMEKGRESGCRRLQELPRGAVHSGKRSPNRIPLCAKSPRFSIVEI